MKHTRSILKIIGGAVAALGFAASAHAAYGGILLFDGADFNGEAREINLPAQRLTAIYFNDRAASVDVQGPGWLLCRDSNFEGPCIVVREPVQNLDRFGMGDRISSARPLSERNPYPHGTVFGQNFYGDIVFYEADLFGNLSEMDPYDSWGYGYGDGYQTGRYGDYGRYGRYGRYNPYNPSYDYDPSDWNGYKGPHNADIVLYRDPNFRGSAYGLNRDVRSLSDLYFNDEVSSIEVRQGRWEVCTDPEFRGQCRIIDASQTTLGPVRLNDTISSVRRVGGNRGRSDHYNGSGRYDDRKHDTNNHDKGLANGRTSQHRRSGGNSDDVLRGGRNDHYRPGQSRTDHHGTDNTRDRNHTEDHRRSDERNSGPRDLRGDGPRSDNRRRDINAGTERQQDNYGRDRDRRQTVPMPVRENDARVNQNNRDIRPQARQTPSPAPQQARPPQRETKQQRLIRNAQQPVANTPSAQVQPAQPSVAQSRRHERPDPQYRGPNRERAEVK